MARRGGVAERSIAPPSGSGEGVSFPSAGSNPVPTAKTNPLNKPLPDGWGLFMYWPGATKVLVTCILRRFVNFCQDFGAVGGDQDGVFEMG